MDTFVDVIKLNVDVFLETMLFQTWVLIIKFYYRPDLSKH